MRRSRFASTLETNDEIRARTSVREAMRFDLRHPESSDERSLAEWRVAGLDFMAILLGFTHLLFIIAYLVLTSRIPTSFGFDNPLIPSVLTLAVDGAACAALLGRRRFNFQSHVVVRSLCVYIALSGLLWTWFGQAVQDDAFVMPISAAQIILSAGISIGTVVSISSPPQTGQAGRCWGGDSARSCESSDNAMTRASCQRTSARPALSSQF